MTGPEPFRVLDEEVIVVDTMAPGGRGQPERFRLADEMGLDGVHKRIDPSDVAGRNVSE